ncbi:hypothetical protein EVAR_93750_1 [Eumeta japonica]|uniref:Uncharacterized protein n=1 Tax=Eumeta variegata TaxID=151549 RepID=A0A4C1TMD8_EUMVA|nr:hypothetical protein EVAR_93750_1 [Eumeta japonica]
MLHDFRRIAYGGGFGFAAAAEYNKIERSERAASHDRKGGCLRTVYNFLVRNKEAFSGVIRKAYRTVWIFQANNRVDNRPIDNIRFTLSDTDTASVVDGSMVLSTAA